MREYLKTTTRPAHDRLDSIAADWPTQGADRYALFLRAQGEARRSFEIAFDETMPFSLSNPPIQTPLIVRDLSDLGQRAPLAGRQVVLPSAFHALGAAWVVAGSSLGNRTMLAQRRKAGQCAANAFLSDEAMPRYFRDLIAVLETIEDAGEREGVVAGAHLAFDLFERAFAAQLLETAA